MGVFCFRNSQGTPVILFLRNYSKQKIKTKLQTYQPMATALNFHQLAKDGKLNTVDLGLLTQENLLIKSADGNTPLNWAATTGHLNQIPYPILKRNFEKIKK
jgi:hypothetical protein